MKNNIEQAEFIRQQLHKLSAYEMTGLTPEEIMSLASTAKHKITKERDEYKAEVERLKELNAGLAADIIELENGLIKVRALLSDIEAELTI